MHVYGWQRTILDMLLARSVGRLRFRCAQRSRLCGILCSSARCVWFAGARPQLGLSPGRCQSCCHPFLLASGVVTACAFFETQCRPHRCASAVSSYRAWQCVCARAPPLQAVGVSGPPCGQLDFGTLMTLFFVSPPHHHQQCHRLRSDHESPTPLAMSRSNKLSKDPLAVHMPPDSTHSTLSCD